MSAHQHDPNANELWAYFQAVIAWVQLTFTTYRKEMKGIDWGSLYNQFKDGLYDTAKLEDEIKALMMDDDVTRKKGIYPYVLTRDEKYLVDPPVHDSEATRGVRATGRHLPRVRASTSRSSEMEADHITPWSKGGKTNAANCQMLCLEDNRRKGAV